jgi:hypothetical protein
MRRKIIVFLKMFPEIENCFDRFRKQFIIFFSSFLSLKFDSNFFCCCSKVTEKLTMELATEIHSQLRAIGVLVIAFSVEVPKFICS